LVGLLPSIPQPHSEHFMRPEGSQKRPPARLNFASSLMALRARSTHPHGIPASGTGIAIHSSLVFSPYSPKCLEEVFSGFGPILHYM
jgi:hypothetical protein